VSHATCLDGIIPSVMFYEHSNGTLQYTTMNAPIGTRLDLRNQLEVICRENPMLSRQLDEDHVINQVVM
jgi:hypothetical protein